MATGLAALLVVMMAGCCGVHDKPAKPAKPETRLGEGKPPPAHGGKTVVAALGDSITAGSPRWDPDPLVRQQLGTEADPESQFEYWAQLRLQDADFRNCGVFGERTDEIAARLQRCASRAQVLILQGGINDIAQMRRVKTAAKNLRDTVVRAKRMGLRVALVEVLPWNNGYRGAAARIRRLNQLIHAIGEDEHVPVFSWHGALEDPKRPGAMRRDLTVEGDHPSVAGYKRLAESVRLP
jgi:lysophospholipase L1-like esterase